MEWIDAKKSKPEFGRLVATALRWSSGKIVYAMLRRVDEDDCEWRTADDNSEISYSIDVLEWMYIPEIILPNATPK